MASLHTALSVLIVSVVAAFAPASGATAASLHVIHDFCAKANCTDGSVPYGEVVVADSDTLFGTTSRDGGPNDAGTAFELHRVAGTGKWKLRTIYRFCSKQDCTDGLSPTGRLIRDVNGNLYGTAFCRAPINFCDGGLIFELMPDGGKWKRKTLYEFCSKPLCIDGNRASGGLAYQGAQTGAPYDGVSPLYGETEMGGAYGQGTVYSLTPEPDTSKWSHRVIHDFCTEMENCGLEDGSDPVGGLAIDANGDLFGATSFGGTNFDGILFKLHQRSKRNWGETVLYTFCSQAGCTDGEAPTGVVGDEAGNLFGMTAGFGGNGKGGTVFKLAPGGDFSTLYDFCGDPDCADGHQPFARLAIDASGTLFGTTITGGGNDIDENHAGGGVVFRVSDGGQFNVLHSFCAKAVCTDGEYPATGVSVAADGTVFGTTYAGGKYGKGVVFELSP